MTHLGPRLRASTAPRARWAGGKGQVMTLLAAIVVVILLVTSSPAVQAVSSAPSGETAVRQLGGSWRSIAQVPIAGPYRAALWTGDEALVVHRDDGRAAAYDPESDTWRTLPPAPRPFERWPGPPVWTGSELLIPEPVGSGPTRETLKGLALEPDSGTWREIPEVVIERPDPSGITDTAWTGDRMLVITLDRQVLAYDPAADTWTVYPEAPDAGLGRHVFWTGTSILAELRSEEDGIALTELDPESLTWSEPSQGPRDPMIAYDGGYWVDGRLVYVTWHSGGLDGLLDSVFDPVTRTWEPFEQGCHRADGAPVVAGRLLVGRAALFALDPRSGQCYRLPARKSRLNRGSVLWTGEELLYVSGSSGEVDPYRRRAESYRPPRWATTVSPFWRLWRPLDPADIPFCYSCEENLPFTTSDMDAARRLDEVPEPLVDAIRHWAERMASGTAGWTVVRQTDRHVLALAPGRRGWIESMKLESEGGVWGFESAGDCRAQTTFLAGRWRLDPRHPAPGPRTRTLHVIGYLGCNGSEKAGRARIHATDEAVLVAIPMRSTIHSDMCHGLGPTRMRVRLPERLGQRALYDAGTLPIRRVVAGRGLGLAADVQTRSGR
jgi:hypothetical protein